MNAMLQPLSRAARWLAAASVALGGCAEVPQSSQQQLQPAAAVQKPAFDPANMKRFRTLDPDEIRRRWGDLELYMGTVFVSKGNTGDDPEFKEFRWVTPGALARVDFLYCYEKTRKCSEGWHWIQYDQEAKRLNFLRSDGVAYAHGVVQPDGMVATTLLTNGRKWESRYDYDKDEGVDQYAAGPTRYTPADRKQYAELQKQWKAVHAQTLAEEQAVAQAREAEQRAAARAREEERQAQRRREEADSAQNINRALTAFGQSYNSSMADYRRQQAQSAALNDRISRSMETSRPAPAPTRSAPTTSYAPTVASRPSIPTITPQAVRPPRADRQHAVASSGPGAAREDDFRARAGEDRGRLGPVLDAEEPRRGGAAQETHRDHGSDHGLHQAARTERLVPLPVAGQQRRRQLEGDESFMAYARGDGVGRHGGLQGAASAGVRDAPRLGMRIRRHQQQQQPGSQRGCRRERPQNLLLPSKGNGLPKTGALTEESKQEEAE